MSRGTPEATVDEKGHVTTVHIIHGDDDYLIVFNDGGIRVDWVGPHVSLMLARKVKGD